MLAVFGRRRWNSLRTAAFGLALIGLMVSVSAPPAHAQGIFNLLNQLFGGMFRPPEPPKPAPAAPAVAYCVRLCDGRFFPLPTSTGSANYSPEKTCNSLCPASATKIYGGNTIDDARGPDGAPYTKLDNAFAYRERVVDGCTCNGKDVIGTVSLDVYADPTLRPGDIVVTRDGPRVFTGKDEAEHRAADFIPPDDFKGLSSSVRKTLAEMRVAPELSVAVQEFAASQQQALPHPPSSFAQDTGAPSEYHPRRVMDLMIF